MKVVLKDPDTGYYFRGDKLWTTNPERGIIFATREQAAAFALQNELKEYRITVLQTKKERKRRG